MNTYRHSFTSECPVNKALIKYQLLIRTPGIVMVEELVEECANVGSDYHEAIADRLHIKFGNYQKLKAEHHGVVIKTTRGVKS